MREDNTPTVTARRRKPTPHMRLRLETAKKLQKLNDRANKNRAKAKKRKLEENDQETKTASVAPMKRLKKNTLSSPDKPAAKFRKRQKDKCWLPTHVFHAKRAHMTEPKHPLWRFAIPLTPTEKSYRKTHRAGSARGCVAWDTSFMSTIGAEGIEASLLGLLRSMGVTEDALSEKKQAKWRKGVRAWEGWMRERDGDQRWIAKVAIVWCAEAKDVTTEEVTISGKWKKKRKRKLIMRAHPSAFFQLWNEVLKVAKMQRPPVMIEDLRFEMGSIEVIGPESTEALISALQPTPIALDEIVAKDSPGEVWSSLSLVTNPSALPLSAILGLNISDPRLHHPPRPIIKLCTAESNDRLLSILSSWPPDITQPSPSIFDRTARLTAARLLPSQRAINRRKGDAPPGKYPPQLTQDPQIPILLIATRSPTSGAQGTWTVLLPWKCVLPVWYSLMHYPLSTGGNPRFGGLQEMRQIAFEQGVPWFPGDFPGTRAGLEWDSMETERRKAEWGKRPKGKRVEWESLDLADGRKGELGRGWACDWEFLFTQTAPLDDAALHTTAVTQSSSGSPAAKDQASKTQPAAANDQAPKEQLPASSKPTATQHAPPPLCLHHVPQSHSLHLHLPSSTIPANALITISLCLLSRGHPTATARIYRLPTTNPALLKRWLSLAEPLNKNKSKSSIPALKSSQRIQTKTGQTDRELGMQKALRSILPPSASSSPFKSYPLTPVDEDYPPVPDKEDLIGFVTTGNFDLGSGRGKAIGSVALFKVLEDEEEEGESVMERKGRLCIVREAGERVGRLARWEPV